MNSIMHKYVEYIPSTLENDVLYISKKYSTVAHNCCCGCENEVITPIGKTDWELIEEEGKITMYPSIGNWSFSCKSHYVINKSRVLWAGQLTDEKIQAGRQLDRLKKEAYFQSRQINSPGTTESIRRAFVKIRKWFNNLF